MDATRQEGNALYLLDQAKFPVTEVWLPYTDYRPVADTVHTMMVWDAPTIGVAAAYAHCPTASVGEGLDEAREILAAGRPTAIDLFWALECMEHKAKECDGVTEPLITEAKAIHTEDVAVRRAMGAHGMAVVPEHTRILTHCNAGALIIGGYGMALSVIRAAHEAGKVGMVYCDEARPLLQGARLMACGLVPDHIPATLIADNIAASLMAKGKIDLAVVRYDHMAVNGNFANKTGTYPVAVNVHYRGIPFYVALPCSTIGLSLTGGGGIPIEEWDRDEVCTLYDTRTVPEPVEVCNPVFDIAPHSLATGIIIKRGIIYLPSQENLQKPFG